jgi:hypothetical protein
LWTTSADAQRKRGERASAVFTPAKISRDLNGQILRGVYNAQTGSSGDWYFAAREPKTIEIRSRSIRGNNAYLEIHIISTSEDGGRELSGTMQVFYVRRAGRWQLDTIATDNPNGGVEVRTYSPSRTPNGSPPSYEAAAPPVSTLVNSSFTIGAGYYQVIPFRMNRAGRVYGDFRANDSGDVEVYVLDDYGLVNFKNRRPAQPLYNSGRVTTARVDAYLQPGQYYLVFSNTYSIITPKAVAARIFLEQ